MSFGVSLRAKLGDLHIDANLTGDGRPAALIGPNGAGKTSLLRFMVGQRPPDATGELWVDELRLVGPTLDREAPPERRPVGYVPQGYGLFGHLLVIDNVAFGLACRRVGRAERHARAIEMLRRLDAERLAYRMPRGLSGGEQQRVALARALLMKPRLLLLDEPMSALDVVSRARMRSVLADVLRAHRTDALLVTHDPRDVRALCERVWVMEAGRIAQHGHPDAVAAHPASAFVAEFFGG